MLGQLGARVGAGALQRKLLQRRAGRSTETPDGDLHAKAAEGTSGAGGALPHAATIQQSFGRHDVSGVRAHTDSNAAGASQAIGAEAYATGNQIAFASAPSLHTAAHEAAHVVQQRAGVHLKGGVGADGDSYEQHADAVADAVVGGKSAEPILDEMAGGGAAAAKTGGATHAVQRKGMWDRVKNLGKKDPYRDFDRDDLHTMKEALGGLRPTRGAQLTPGDVDQFFAKDPDAHQKIVDGIMGAAHQLATTSRPKKVDQSFALRARYQHLSAFELNCIIGYSNSYFQAMNGVLRGQLTTKMWDPIREVVVVLQQALAKVKAVPDESRMKNLQVGRARAALDDGSKQVPNNVMRGDKWNPAMNPRFMTEYRQGNTITEASFLSTTVRTETADTFSGHGGVVRMIRGVQQVGISIEDISANSHEKELLLPAGVQMKLDRIQVLQAGKPPRLVADPTTEFPRDNQDAKDRKAFNQEGMSWLVDATVVGGSRDPGGPEKKAASAKPKAKPGGVNESGEGEHGASESGEGAAPDPLAELAAVGKDSA